MELKKNPKADLEKRRGLYLEIGLVVILAASLIAFNVKSYDRKSRQDSSARQSRLKKKSSFRPTSKNRHLLPLPRLPK